jgi:hypothetical protein
MAAIQIENGQQVVAPVNETEIQLAAGQAISRDLKFRVTSGTVQVTTSPPGLSGVIGGSIHAYGTDEPDFMTIEPGGTSMYIKGTGTIFFSF